MHSDMYRDLTIVQPWTFRPSHDDKVYRGGQKSERPYNIMQSSALKTPNCVLDKMI